MNKLILGAAMSASLAVTGWSLWTTVDHTSRISVTESKVAYSEDSLRRIEAKVDWIIEQMTGGVSRSEPRQRPRDVPKEPPQRP